jgi:hypothetical protein
VKKDESIRLHKEWGLNPTIVTCFWCGKDKNELALLGAAYNAEAPKNMVVNYDPCDTCKSEWKQGILLLEASTEPLREGQPPLSADKQLYPTGRLMVIRSEAAAGLFDALELPADVVRAAMAQGMLFVDPKLFDAIKPRHDFSSN